MARLYADNVVHLMPPGGAGRRCAERGALPAYTHTRAPRVLPLAGAEATPRAATDASRASLAWVLLLATICVLPVAAGTWRALARQAQRQHIATVVDEAHPLPAGGRMQLAAGTVLDRYPDALRLQHGQLQLQLPPAAARALTVQAGEGEIASRAGGRVRVDRQAGHTRVMALQGAVSVLLPASDQGVILQAGQQVDYGYDRLGQPQPLAGVPEVMAR